MIIGTMNEIQINQQIKLEIKENIFFTLKNERK